MSRDEEGRPRPYFTQDEQMRLLSLMMAEESIKTEIGAIIGPVRQAQTGDKDEWNASVIKPIRDKARDILRKVAD